LRRRAAHHVYFANFETGGDGTMLLERQAIAGMDDTAGTGRIASRPATCVPAPAIADHT
jgi:hypothetical protein